MQQNSSYLPFRTAAVLGAGVMGAQIAAHLANAGLQVHLLDIPAKEGKKNSIVEGAFKKTLKMKPNPFANKAASGRITLGNFDEHFDRIAEAEWVIEVVIENMKIKQDIMERIEKVARPDAIISSNTSGLPIHLISEGRSDDFKKRFMGTHFFNPPRYLKLLEIIPTPSTDSQYIDRIKWFGRVHLGKSIVIAKDTPNFIANRIGNYATLQTMRFFTEQDYTIEEIDALTGPLIGHAKSATFRTLDVVGLDTMLYVADNLYKAIPEDESREAHQAPDILRQLVEKGMLGAKTKAGFYKKVGKDILSLNTETFEFEPPKPMNIGDVKAFKKAGKLADRVKALYADEGRAGAFTRASMLDLMGYCARRVPEIADRPVDIDNAICWGFGWEMGPFSTWDTLGFEKVLADMREAGIEVPSWIEDMEKNGDKAFYRDNNGVAEVYAPGSGYVSQTVYADHLTAASFSTSESNELIKRKEAALLDMGDGVALYEFRSKSNSLGNDVVEGIFEAINYVEQNDFHGLVIGNDGRNFSVGANLGEMAFAVMGGKMDMIPAATKRFQDMINRVRYARKPVVLAIQGMTLGGGCEMAMAAAGTVAAFESYVGLVELGAGLIPGGCGTTHLTYLASKSAPNGFANEVQASLITSFTNVATAKVATSAFEAREMGFLGENAKIVMHAERRLAVAKEEVLCLSRQGYAPPPVRGKIKVLGQPGRAVMEAAAYQMKEGGYASDYDRYLAGRLAYIMTGGKLTGFSEVHEQYLYDLEREVFHELLTQKKTLERIESILTTNKPLRN